MSNNVTPDSTVYEFNAPQFLNFTTPNITDDDGADRFFDTVTEQGQDIIHQKDTKDDGSSSLVSSSSSGPRPFLEGPDSASNSNKDGLSEDKAAPSKNNELNYILTEVSAKIQEAKATASARSVKRAFAPAIEYSEDNPESCKIVAVEIFHPGIPLQPRRKCTKVVPFSFEERHKRLMKEKEEKIKKVLEEERKMREFHANPVPKFIEPSMQYSTVICTDSKEFKLRTEERIQERKKNKTEDCKKTQAFKARPATVLKKPPFEPKKAELPLTDVTDIHLNTEERAKKREEFNALIKKKEAELELLRLQRKIEEEKALEEEIKKMRKEAVHKANPIPIFKPVPRIISNLPLTEPKSPCFASRKLNKVHQH